MPFLDFQLAVASNANKLQYIIHAVGIQSALQTAYSDQNSFMSALQMRLSLPALAFWISSGKALRISVPGHVPHTFCPA